MTNSLAPQVAVVTGAGHGLGYAIARAFARAQCRLLLVGRRLAPLEAAREQLRQFPGQIEVLSCDVTRLGASDEVAAACDAAFGRWDILVHCAGVYIWKDFLKLTDEDWDTTVSTNLTASFRLTHKLVCRLVARRATGVIINIGSIHGVLGDAHAVAQCASKFGLVGLTKAAAEACREYGIRVNAIAPGAIASETPERLSVSPSDKVTQADVAQLAVYLASDEARLLTGVTLDAFGHSRPVIRGTPGAAL